MIFEDVKEVEIKAVNGRVEVEGWESDHAKGKREGRSDIREE